MGQQKKEKNKKAIKTFEPSNEPMRKYGMSMRDKVIADREKKKVLLCSVPIQVVKSGDDDKKRVCR